MQHWIELYYEEHWDEAPTIGVSYGDPSWPSHSTWIVPTRSY